MFSQKERELIERQKILRLATADKNGKPHVVPVWFVLDGKTVYVHSDVGLKKNKNMKENPFVSVVWDEVTASEEVHGVMVQGTAKHLPDDKEYDKVRKLLYNRYPHYYNKKENHFEYDEVDIFRIDVEGKVSW